ncbi:hypothetical protein FCV25MIE_16383 [Fagus crenata]
MAGRDGDDWADSIGPILMGTSKRADSVLLFGFGGLSKFSGKKSDGSASEQDKRFVICVPHESLGIAGVCRIAGVNARKGIMEWECAYLSHHLEFLFSVIVLGNVDATLSLLHQNHKLLLEVHDCMVVLGEEPRKHQRDGEKMVLRAHDRKRKLALQFGIARVIDDKCRWDCRNQFKKSN